MPRPCREHRPPGRTHVHVQTIREREVDDDDGDEDDADEDDDGGDLFKQIYIHNQMFPVSIYEFKNCMRLLAALRRT